MKLLCRLLILAVLVTGAAMVAPEAQAQRITIAIGDRPYYTRGPSYWENGVEYYWVPGHRDRHNRWVRGHYVRRTTPLGRLHRKHKKVHRAIFGR